MERLRYEEYFTSFLGNNSIVCYDPTLKDFYISKSDDGYILSPDENGGGGLGRVRYAPSSLIAYSNHLYGPAHTGSAGYSFSTGVIHADSRKAKTCETVEIGKATPTDSTCILSYKAKTGSYKTDGPNTFSEVGVIDFIRTGMDFFITCASDTDNSENIPYANVTFRDTTEKQGLAGYVS